MIRHRRAALAAAVALSAGLALSACTPGPDAAGPDRDIQVGLSAGMTSLVPWQNVGYVFTQNAGFAIFDTLIKFDNEGVAQPVLAESWEVNDDLTETVLTVRTDAVFHDGTPVTAADIAYSIDLRTNPELVEAHGSWQLYGADVYESVVATDDSTVTVTTQTPFRLIDALRRVLVVPEGAADDPDFGLAPIGSGPFEFVSFDSGVQLALAAFDDYWGGRPEIDTLTFNTIADIGQQSSALRSGDIDVLYDIKPAEFSQVADVEGVTELETGQYFTWWMTQTNGGITGTPEGRAALRYLIDKPQINASAYNNEGDENWNPFDLTPVGIQAEVDAEYDPARAAELLAEAGLEGEALSIMALEGYEDSVRMGQLIEQAATEAGIPVEFKVASVPEYLDTTYTNPTWSGLAYGAGTFPFPFYDAFDYMILGNPEMSALIREMRAASDEELDDLVAQAQELMVGDTLVLPMVVAPVRTLVPTYLSGVEATSFGDVRWGDVTFAE